MRSQPALLEEVDRQLQHGKRPREVYQELTSAQPDEGPRDMQQVYNTTGRRRNASL